MGQSPDKQDANEDIIAKLPKKEPTPAFEVVPELEVVKPEPLPATIPRKDDTPITSRPAQEQPSAKEKNLRRLWTIASAISMIINVVVVFLLIFLVGFYLKSSPTFALPADISADTPKDLLKGLYDNFQLMDAAHIETDILVKDEIPVVFDLELKQATNVTLSEDVTIRGAYVVINTATINISAPATVTLPAGTNLPIVLDLIVPVDKMVPVELNVPVDIALKNTDLHIPFVGLQDVVKPLYCLVDPKAKTLLGVDVCP